MQHKNGVALWCAVLAAVIWGSTYVVTTELLPPHRPLLAALARALPAGLLLLLWQRQLPQGHWWWRALVLGTLNIGLFFYCLFVAAYHLPGGVAALVMSSQPIWVMLLSVFLLKQPLSGKALLAAVVAMLGLVLLVSLPNVDLSGAALSGTALSGTALSGAGLLAGFCAALSMALGIVLSKKWPKPAHISLVTFTGWQLLAGGLLLLPITLLQEGLPEALSRNHLLGFVYLCLIGAVLAYLLWFKALQQLPAVTLSFLTFCSPLSALLFGYLFLDQQLSMQQSLGSLAILAAIVLAQRQPAVTLNSLVTETTAPEQLVTKPADTKQASPLFNQGKL